MPPSELPSQAEPLKEEIQRDRSCLALITECDENKEEDVGGQRVDALFDGAAAAIPHLSVTGSQRNFDQSKPTRRKARKNPLNNDTPLLKHGLEDLTLSVEEKKEEFANCQQPDASACVADAVPPVSTTGLCPFRHGTVYGEYAFLSHIWHSISL